jgi:hypothetical protein
LEVILGLIEAWSISRIGDTSLRNNEEQAQKGPKIPLKSILKGH